MINQIWAGHPGSQALAGVGSNSQLEVWTKPLGGDRTAVLVVNTADKTALDQVALEEQGGNLNLVECNSSRPSQNWITTPGAITNVMPAKSNDGKPQCWSIHGCGTKPGSGIEVGDGCKPLPKPPYNPCPKACDCNDAWEFYDNGTIASAMDGQCLTAAAAPDDDDFKPPSNKIELELCKAAGDKTQQWKVAKGSGGGSTIASQAQPGMCVDSEPAGPVAPPCIPPKCTPGAPVSATIKFADLNLGFSSGAVKVRDVWNKKDLADALATGGFNTTVPHHGCTFYVFSKPGGLAWPEPFKVADWLARPAPPVPPVAVV